MWACKVIERENVPSAIVPGEVVEAAGEGILVGTGDGLLLLTTIQPAGKKAMPAAEFLKGAKLSAGTQFGGGIS
ncbi:Methionyl-tRNA formyltransferase [compost metagenome]